MPYIIIIDKNGIAKEHNIKNIKFNENNLYKKIGLKTNNNFECIYVKNNIYLYGKKVGSNNYLNKFRFNFLNNINLYGSCIILQLDNSDKDNSNLVNFKLDDFNEFIEKENNIDKKIEISSTQLKTPENYINKSLKLNKKEKNKNKSFKNKDKSDINQFNSYHENNNTEIIIIKNELKEEEYI